MLRTITINNYGKNGIYYSTRDIDNKCFICKHYSVDGDLRKSKRYIVIADKGRCNLDCNIFNCKKFEKIDELRAKNMDVLEKVYFAMYPKKYLNTVVKFHYKDPKAKFQKNKFFREELAKIIIRYQNKNR